MPNRTPVHFVNSPEQYTIKFRFLINGTSDPDSLVPFMAGVTDVARTGTGVFTVQFSGVHPVFLGLIGSVIGPASGSAVNDQTVKCAIDSYVNTTGVLTVTVVDAGTAAAADPTDNSWVYCEATFCRMSQLCPAGAI